MTTKLDPLARLRATIAALDPDQPLPFDAFRHSFATQEHGVATPKPPDLLGSRHFRHFRHSAEAEAVGSTPTPSLAGSTAHDDLVCTSPIDLSKNSGESGESGEKAPKAADCNGFFFATGSAGVATEWRQVATSSAAADDLKDDYPLVIVDDQGQPCSRCGWCGSGAFWRPAAPDHRWRCQECEPANHGAAHVWSALP